MNQYIKVHSFSSLAKMLQNTVSGAPGWLSRLTNFSSGHDLTACGSSPTSGSVLTAQRLEPASDSVSLSLSPSPTHALSLSLSNINKH